MVRTKDEGKRLLAEAEETPKAAFAKMLGRDVGLIYSKTRKIVETRLDDPNLSPAEVLALVQAFDIASKLWHSLRGL